MRFFLSFLLVFAIPVVGCSDSNHCDIADDCPDGYSCVFNMCLLEGGGDGIPGEEGDKEPLSCDEAAPGDLVMTEVLAGPPKGVDIRGDGNTDHRSNEFVEILNVSSKAVALTSVEVRVRDKKVQVAHVCLDPMKAYVMWGTERRLPQLPNSGAEVGLVIGGQEVQTLAYGSEADKGSALTLLDQFDPESNWVVHSEMWSRAYSPGGCPNGRDFPDCDAPDTDPGGGDNGGGGQEEAADCEGVPGVGDLVINEVMSDPGPTASGSDANGDGVINARDDEFIEIVNVSGETLNLQGVVIGGNDKVRYTFPALCLAHEQAVVVFGKYEGLADIGEAIGISGGNLGLVNGGEEVALFDREGAQLDSVVYTQVSGAKRGNSFVRSNDYDGEAALILHEEAPFSGGARLSPGFCQNGKDFPDCDGPPEGSEVLPGEDDCGPRPEVGDLVLNELMPDPGNGEVGADSNGDGVISATDDEYIEILNQSGGPLWMDGVQLAGNNKNRYTFGKVCLEAGRAAVVFGRYDGEVSFGEALAISGGNLRLVNSGDEVSILTHDDLQLDTFAYRAADVRKGDALVREYDGGLSSPFVFHSEAPVSEGAMMSPGRCQNGREFPLCD